MKDYSSHDLSDSEAAKWEVEHEAQNPQEPDLPATYEVILDIRLHPCEYDEEFTCPG
jgi:hypothetical protein